MGTEAYVHPIWRNVALGAAGIVLGALPGYVSLVIDHRTAVTIVDVDHEITIQNAAIVERLLELKEQVAALDGKLDEVQKMQEDSSRGQPRR